MDKTPTLKTAQSPSPPNQRDVLDEAQKLAAENHEYVGATVQKSLTSPMLMKSPSLQARMIEYAERVIDPVDASGSVDRGEGVEPVVQESIKISTPTLKKTPSQKGISSPENPCAEVLPKSPAIQQIEKKIAEDEGKAEAEDLQPEALESKEVKQDNQKKEQLDEDESIANIFNAQEDLVQ